MKLFKLLVLSATVLSTQVKADLNVISHSVHHDDAEEGFVGLRVAPRNNSALIRQAAVHASAAYNDTNLVALKSSPLRNQTGFPDRERLAEEGYEVVSFSASIPGRGNVPAGIVTFKREASGRARVHVSFHGSESVEDFTEANLRAFKVQDRRLGVTGYIHGGFYARYMQSREALFDIVGAVLTAHNLTANDVDFEVSGHSLGGALATLAATDIKTNLAQNSSLDLVTFSSPRVLDHRAAAEVENNIGGDHMIRVWRGKDFVPMVSLGTQILGWVTGFKHVGQSVKLAPTVSTISLTNHSLDSIKRDALSSNAVDFDTNHVGYRTWIGNKASAGLESVCSAGRRAWGWISSRFSRA